MIDEIFWDGLEAAKAHADFQNGGWLTFYLMGHPSSHRSTWLELKRLGTVNLKGEEGGFVYAKFPVSLDQAKIEQVFETVWKLASEADLDCQIVDLDASPDVERSKFFTLWTAG